MYEVLYPVGFPDEGTFEWLDDFLAKNPKYVELSDRKLQEWLTKSGIWKANKSSWKSSNDKPEFSFGMPQIDDKSAVRVINSLVPLVPRHYVVMEVKSNLLKADRETSLKRFRDPKFKKVAHVVMGEPPKEFKAKVQQKLLADKQIKVEKEWNKKKQEKKQKKLMEARQKQLQEMQKKAQEKKKQMEE